MACSCTVVADRRCIGVALALACCRVTAASDDTTSGTSETSAAASSTEDTSDGSTTAAPIDGPPRVLDIGKSALSLTVGERATLTAFVSHPRGDAAVVGGTLLGPGEPAEYATFVRGEGGRWSTELAWDDTARHTDLTFDSEVELELVARFVDDAGLHDEMAFTMRHRCIPLVAQACDGVCVDPTASLEHCGSCGRSCIEQHGDFTYPVGGCVNGECGPLWSPCVDLVDYVNCDGACAMQGQRCVPYGCDGGSLLPVVDGRCELPPEPWWDLVDPNTCETSYTGGPVRCCCTQ